MATSRRASKRPIAAIGRNLTLLRANLAQLDAREAPDPLLPRGIARVLLRLLGRPIVCTECGRPMFRALPVVWRGKVWMIGGYDRLFHVSFGSTEALEFRHGQLDECPAPTRPWVR